MDAQQQAQAPLANKGKKRRFSRRTIIITIIIAGVFIAAAQILSNYGIIPGIVAAIISSLIGVYGVIFTLLAIIPADAGEPAPAVPPPTIFSPDPPTTSAPPDKPASRGIVGSVPPTSSNTIQQREQAVQDIYGKLTQPGTSAAVLTGIGGQGKSTLAALVYRHAEAQQRAGHSYFGTAPLWLRVDPAVTLADILTNICDALQARAPDIASLSPQNQAYALFNVLNSVDQPRLVVLDQFENLLDDEGNARDDRPGVGEWLDALNNSPCACRVLLTSRPDPQGTRDYPSTCLLIQPVDGLSEAEGVELLRKWNVNATEAEMRAAVKRCNGHAMSLTLLAALLQKRRLTLAALLSDPQLWKGNLAKKLLDDIYQGLDGPERRLLAAFSVYREPAPIEAAVAINADAEFTRRQTDDAIDTLLAQHLLDAKGEGRYQPHTIVAEYARDHLVVGDERANHEALLASHTRSAHYYQERAKTTCPPREQRRKIDDVHDLIEAVWQYCQAEQWQDAYELMEEENIFRAVDRWGGNTVLLEVYQLLESGNQQLEPAGQARIAFILGEICRSLGQIERGLNYFQQALQICKNLGERSMEGVVLNGIGLMHNRLGRYQQAIESHKEALKIKQDMDDRRGEAATLQNLGGAYGALGQKQKALDYYQQALTIRREASDRRGEGTTLHNLGAIYNDLEQKQKALDYYKQALAIRREVGDRGGEGATLWNIGVLCYSVAHYDVALACFLLARSIYEEVENPRRYEVQEWIDRLRRKVGVEQYDSLLAEVEPRAAETVEQALREGGML